MLQSEKYYMVQYELFGQNSLINIRISFKDLSYFLKILSNANQIKTFTASLEK
jgi:hypothetical protein